MFDAANLFSSPDDAFSTLTHDLSSGCDEGRLVLPKTNISCLNNSMNFINRVVSVPQPPTPNQTHWTVETFSIVIIVCFFGMSLLTTLLYRSRCFGLFGSLSSIAPSSRQVDGSGNSDRASDHAESFGLDEIYRKDSRAENVDIKVLVHGDEEDKLEAKSMWIGGNPNESVEVGGLTVGMLSGSKVEANKRGQGVWYPGNITKMQDGVCDISYDNGELEVGVVSAMIRPIARLGGDDGAHRSPPSSFGGNSGFPLNWKHKKPGWVDTSHRGYVVGLKVEGNKRGQGVWYPGNITSIDEDKGTVDISYDNGEGEGSVPLKMVRKLMMGATSADSSIGLGVQNQPSSSSSLNFESSSEQKSPLTGQKEWASLGIGDDDGHAEVNLASIGDDTEQAIRKSTISEVEEEEKPEDLQDWLKILNPLIGSVGSEKLDDRSLSSAQSRRLRQNDDASSGTESDSEAEINLSLEKLRDRRHSDTSEEEEESGVRGGKRSERFFAPHVDPLTSPNKSFGSDSGDNLSHRVSLRKEMEEGRHDLSP